MYFLLTLKTAVVALRTNMGRSLLTILGIVIGIVAIVLVIAMGQAAQNLILSEVQSIGGNTIILRPGRQPEGPADVADTILADSIREREVEALKRPENVPNLASVEPAVLVSGAVTYQDEVFRPIALGWTADGLTDIFELFPEEGTFFTDDDIRQRSKVIVLGHRAKTELFGESDALGEFVKLREQNFRVVGVLPKAGQVAVFNVDDLVLLPYSTAQKDLLGISHFHELILQAEDGADIDQVAEDVRVTLRDLHGITDPSKDDFFVLTQENIADQIETVTQVLTIFLVSIASIALVVGGVGIMNIMLVSVTERTREVGLRKAVGATRKDILQQFLLEAVLLTGVGGLIGTTLALLLSFLVAFIARQQFNIAWPFTLPIGGIVLGVGVSTLIGLIFGLYPARKAAKKSPIEALRYE